LIGSSYAIEREPSDPRFATVKVEQPETVAIRAAATAMAGFRKITRDSSMDRASDTKALL
jgi:hypothetical protein